MDMRGRRGGSAITSPHDLLVDLIDSVYAATTAPERWSAFLDRVSRVYSGPAALRIGHGADIRKHQISAATFDPAFLQSYAMHYGEVCPFTKRDATEQTPTLIVEEGLMPLREVERTEFYADWMRPQGLKRALRARVEPSADRTIDLLILRSEQVGEFQAVEQSVLSDLLPHVRRAAEIARRLGTLETHISASLHAFDRLGVGVALVTATRRVVFTNGIADRLLAAGDGITAIRGRLMASAHVQDRLDAALAAATGFGRNLRGRTASVLAVARSAAAAPLSVSVAPLDEREQPFFIVEPLALVVIGAPELSSPVTEETLRACYDFTPAEARMVAALCAGETLSSYAALSRTSLNTVKTHLKAVFEKTGESRQADLVRAIATNPILRLHPSGVSGLTGT
jgi:DNA-binding CsgD family transcriptional regulator